MAIQYILRPLILCVALLAGAISAGVQTTSKYKLYDARTAPWEILTPDPVDAPRINGPRVYGARPSKQFVYRIPCQGKRPIHFEVEGLPEDLVLDTGRGIITGHTPARAGTYTIKFSAMNQRGSDTRPFKLIVGDQIALTPPMGWNSWGGHMLLVSDEVMRRATDVIVNRGLADVGFQYVSIDDCWMRIDPAYFEQNRKAFEKRMPGFPFQDVVGPGRDEDGMVLPNRRFPDMKALTDYIHSFGLKAGIYGGPDLRTCQGFIASFAHERADAQQYAEWGFDLLKYDLCSGRATLAKLQKALPPGSPEISELPIWYPMTQYLAEQEGE